VTKLTVQQKDRDAAVRVIPAAVIFAEAEDHVADLRERAALVIAEVRQSAYAAGIDDAVRAVAGAGLPKARWSCSDDDGGTSLTLGRQRRFSIERIRALSSPNLDPPIPPQGEE
jgi:hypothetical protein